MRRLILYLVLMFAAPVVAQDEAGKIEALIRPHSDAGLFSGTVLVARGDEVLLQQSYGFANWELRFPNSASTRYGIGSIAKLMTLNIVDTLISDGTIGVDDRVGKYIPGFPAGPGGGEATVEHLINHRSGVLHRVTSAAEETQIQSAADLVDKVIQSGLRFEPGSERLYSSAGYTVLARVLEIAGEAAFGDLIETHVFEPAGMTRASPESGQRLMDGRAVSYRLGAEDGRIVVRNTPYKDLRFLTGAGSVYATATDMLRYANAVRSGNFGARARAELADSEPDAWQGIYGRTNGYEASVDVLESADLIFVLLTNLQSATTGQVRAGVRTILTGGDAPPIPMPPAVAEHVEPAAEIVGTYGRADIHVADGALFRGENEFYPIDGGYYILGSGTRMSFRRDPAGVVDALISISLGGRESVLPKTGN